MEGHFALSWVLTLFAHVVEDFDVISRIFDAIMAAHPLFPLYLAVAVVVARREHVLAVPCEYSAVYKAVNGLAGQCGDYEAHFILARQFMLDVPPHTLLALPGLTKDTLALLTESDLPGLTTLFARAQSDPATHTLQLLHPPPPPPVSSSSALSSAASTASARDPRRWLRTITRERVAYAVGTVVWAASLVFANDLAGLLSPP